MSIDSTQAGVRLRSVCLLNPPVPELRRLPDEADVTFLPLEAVWDLLDLRNRRPRGQAGGGYSEFREGDLLLPKITPTFQHGRSVVAENLANGVGFGTTELHILRPDQRVLEVRYLLYVTKSSEFLKRGTADMYGVAGQKRVSDDFVKNYRIWLPILGQQQAIVRFLDREIAALDALKEKKERLLNLLTEQLDVTTTHVLFLGADHSNRADSGVEWLAEIAKGWKTRRAGALFRERDERGEPNLPLLEVSLNRGVTIRHFSGTRIERVVADFGQQKVARQGDLVFNKMRMWQGAVGVAPEDGLVSTDYTVAEPASNVDAGFFAAVLRTHRAKVEIDKWSHGMVRDRNRLYWDGFKNIRLPLPPLADQHAILRLLDHRSQETTLAQSKIGRAIESLEEYRSALITAAVTGQIDVTGATS